MSSEVSSAQIIERDKKSVTPAIYRYTDIAFARGEGFFFSILKANAIMILQPGWPQ